MIVFAFMGMSLFQFVLVILIGKTIHGYEMRNNFKEIATG